LFAQNVLNHFIDLGTWNVRNLFGTVQRNTPKETNHVVSI
jgi:hypothetical protein